jgi:hypothetical protein
VPVSHKHYNTPFAAHLAAHNEFLDVATHRPDGVVLPAPLHRPNQHQRVDARVYALEHFERRMRDLLANPIPEVPPCR